MKKIAIYARQSLDKKDSISIQTQVDFCKKLIDPNEQIEVYTDKGYSGKNTNRPEFQRLMADVRTDKISTVYCYKLDRISRSILDFNLMWKDLQAHKCQFVSYSEKMLDTTTPTGEAQVQMVMVFAQLERQTIALRVKDNYYDRIRRDGRWAGGPAPFGFRNARTPDNKPTLEVNPEEMQAVRYCFHQYAYSPNISLGQLCRQLTEKGSKSRRKNGAWDNVTIARMLQSPVYAVADERLKKYLEIRKINFLNEGKWTGETSCHVVGKRKGNSNLRRYTNLEEQSVYLTNFSGEIDSKTFIMVQERLATNEQIKRSNAPSVLQELAGLLKCADCGYAVKSYSKSPDGKHPYLACYGKYGLKVCDTSFAGVHFEDIQKKVGQEIQKELDKIAMEILNELGKDKEKERQIGKYEKQIDNLIDLVALGGDSAKAVHAKIEQLQQKIQELQLSEFMDAKATERLRISEHLPIIYDRLSTDEKKSICQQMIEKIMLSHNGDIEIIWKI